VDHIDGEKTRCVLMITKLTELQRDVKRSGVVIITALRGDAGDPKENGMGKGRDGVLKEEKGGSFVMLHKTKLRGRVVLAENGAIGSLKQARRGWQAENGGT